MSKTMKAMAVPGADRQEMPNPAVEPCPLGEAKGRYDGLPTLQKNALRKIFDRPEFTAEEVALLGHRKLLRAEGIGNKGLATIIEWLRSQGYELAVDPAGAGRAGGAGAKSLKRLEKAIRVLKTHGYAVVPAAGFLKDSGTGGG